MKTPPKPKKVVAPEGCKDYLTEGKEYEVIGIWDDCDESYGYGFYIINDTGNETLCMERKCATINRKNWIVTEYETL